MPLNNENNNNCCKCTTPEYEIILNQQGPQGRQGQQGQPGFSPEITVASNTYNNYQLRIQTATGTITTPNLKSTLPPGGNTNDLLIKNSSAEGDIGWANINSIPNVVTTDTMQTITAMKIFDGTVQIRNSEFTTNNERIEFTINPNQCYMSFDTGGSSSADIGTFISSGQEEMYIAPPYGSQVLYLNNYNGGTSQNGIASKVQIAGPLFNKINGIEYPVLTNNNLQEYLVAGNNITLTPDDTGKITVASSGGTTGNYVTLDGDDTIGGYKTFSHAFTVGESTAANVSYGSQYIIPYNISEEHGFRIEPGGNDIGTKNLNIGRTNFTQWNTVNIAANNLTFNDEPLLTSDNISQNEYIKQLEQRIAALEALIDGGTSAND